MKSAVARLHVELHNVLASLLSNYARVYNICMAHMHFYGPVQQNKIQQNNINTLAAKIHRLHSPNSDTAGLNLREEDRRRRQSEQDI